MRQAVKISDGMGNSKPHPFGIPFLCRSGKAMPTPPSFAARSSNSLCFRTNFRARNALKMHIIDRRRPLSNRKREMKIY